MYTQWLRESNLSMSTSLDRESNQKTKPLEIFTDSRHQWRKISHQTDVICIGVDTKKVVAYEVVTTDDDLVAQHHEILVTKRIYKQLDDQNVAVGKHAHDNNSSITKYVRESRQSTMNQLNNWHALKQLEKELKLIPKGPKKSTNLTWHPQLEDKGHAIRAHAYCCMENCD